MQPLPAAVPYSSGEHRLITAVILFVAVVHIVSFAFLFNLAAHNPEALPYPIVAADSAFYSRLADNLLTHHAYSDSPDMTPSRTTPPGYPLFLAAVKGVTGSFTPAVVIQTLLALFALLILYDIGRRFMPPWLAALVALFYGLDPMVVFSDTTIITDGMFSALFIIIVYLGFFQSRLRGSVRAGLVGIFIGVAVMIRPIGEFLVVILPAAYALRERFRAPSQREEAHPVRAFAAYVLCVALILVPWIVHNYKAFGIFEISHGGANIQLYYDARYFLAWKEMGASPTGVLYPAHHAEAPVFAVVDREIAQALASSTPPGGISENYTGSVALHFMFEDPFRYAYFHLANTIPFFLGGSVSTYVHIVHQERDNTDFSAPTLNAAQAALADLRQPGSSMSALLTLLPIVLELLWWIFVCVLALGGLVFEWRRFEAWLFAGLVAYFALLTGALSIARYRIPAEPFLLALAGMGTYAIISRIRSRREGGAASVRILKILTYLVSGGTGFVINIALYGVLVYGFAVWYIAASVVSFFVSLVFTFLMQKFFTFRNHAPAVWKQQFAAYLLLALLNICANAVLLFLLVEYVGAGKIEGLVISSAVIAVWNFFVYERLIFISPQVTPVRHASARVGLSDLSVIIPCHNEEASIASVVDAVPAGVREIIVVDNNSTDKSAQIAREKGARVVTEERQGYGAAAKRGFADAQGSILAVIDGDNQHPAEELSRIVDMLVDADLDFISASRFPLQAHAPMTLLRRTGNWGLTLAADILFGIPLTDSQCGMVVFRKSLLARIEPKSDDVVFVQELKIRAAREADIRFAEYRIPCLPRVAGVSKVFPFRHGVKLLYALIRLRLRG